MSISLGTPEVYMNELVGAYGVFAAGGWLAEQIFISRVSDRDGKQLFEKRPSQKQVISEESAFIMAHVMKGVIENGTATILRALGRPVAGKTGTTNDLMDAWFVGYTPEWAAGVWVGFDVKRTIGRLETGGKAAAPIFLYFMQEFLKDEPPLDFIIPDGVVPVAINRSSGQVVDPASGGAFIEYFKTGTEPSFRPAIPESPETTPAEGSADAAGDDEAAHEDYNTSDEM
jgi:penicillin-binding protein 1A